MYHPSQLRSLLLLSGALLILHCTGGPAAAPTLPVGAAATSINPPAGAFIAGDRQNRTFRGIHDSLYAKAVAIGAGEQQLTLLTIDCIGLTYPELLAIRKAVSELAPGAGIQPERIVLSSTHTHAGPDVVGLWGPDQLHSGVDKAYLARLVQTAAATVVRAWQSQQAGRIRYAEATHGEGWVFNICEPEVLDRSVGILQFVDRQGRSIASLSNFACHPTFMDASSDQVSADYVGGFYRHLDTQFGGVNLFLQGAIGGWVQPEGQEGTHANAFAKGQGLAEVVCAALKDAPFMPQTDLQYRRKTFKMPLSNPGFLQLAAIGVLQRPVDQGVDTEMAWFRIGDAQFITHPGETVPAYSLACKQMMPGSGPKFVLGLGMDALGYILPPTFFEANTKIPHAEYLTSMSVDKQAGEVVMQTAGVLIRGE